MFNIYYTNINNYIINYIDNRRYDDMWIKTQSWKKHFSLSQFQPLIHVHTYMSYTWRTHGAYSRSPPLTAYVWGIREMYVVQCTGVRGYVVHTTYRNRVGGTSILNPLTNIISRFYHFLYMYIVHVYIVYIVNVYIMCI